MTEDSQLIKDISNKVDQDFRKWIQDALQLFDIAEVPHRETFGILTSIMMRGAMISLLATKMSRNDIHAAVDITLDELIRKKQQKESR